jgi:two-component system, OmpR family, alkaline phosphatase synthesis response regulator PhoP
LNKKVLIVDDEDFLRSFYSHYFVNKGFTVLEADNGLDGVSIAEAEKPELILLDLIMPGMHGFAVCKQLRENPAFDDTTIIITSAKSYKPDIDKALELGADAYVIKPVEFDDLYQIVTEKMKQRERKGT